MRDERRHHARFRQNRLNRGRDMAIFQFFQDGDRRHLGFLKFQNFNRRNGQEGRTASACMVVFITVQNLVGIDAVVLIVCTFFDFASLA